MPFNGHTYGILAILNLLALSSYACVIVGSVVLRKVAAFSTLVQDCAERITPGRAQFRLGFWGLALAVAVPWIAAEFFHTGKLAVLGLAMIPVAIALVGTALAIAGLWIERSLESGSMIGSSDKRFNGVLLFVLAAAMPVLGWIVVALLILPSLGATAEYLISGGAKTRSHQALISSDGSAELVATNSSEDAA